MTQTTSTYSLEKETNIKWTCDLCDKDYASKKLLQGHMKSHEQKRHRCDYCEAEFTKLKQLT